MSHVLVFAKDPQPGRVKTRLVPPLTFRQAAQLAEAFLMDLVENLSRLPAITVSLQVGPPDASRCTELFPGMGIATQVGHDLGARLDHATSCVLDEWGGPVLVAA